MFTVFLLLKNLIELIISSDFSILKSGKLPRNLSRCVMPIIAFRWSVVILVMWYLTLTMICRKISRVGPSLTFGHDTTDGVVLNPGF